MLSSSKQGIRIYVHDTVKFSKEEKKRTNATQVLAMKPLIRVVFIKLALNLYKYLLPKVILPKLTEINPITILMYSYELCTVVVFASSKNISARSGALTLISFDPCAIASIIIETIKGISNSLSMRLRL